MFPKSAIRRPLLARCYVLPGVLISASVSGVKSVVGRRYISFCNSLIYKELLHSVWISGQKIFGNPRLKQMILDYQCVTEGAVASSRLLEFVPAR